MDLVLQGSWVHNRRHGLGKQVYSNGDIYEGLWRGLQEGPGRCGPAATACTALLARHHKALLARHGKALLARHRKALLALHRKALLPIGPLPLRAGPLPLRD